MQHQSGQFLDVYMVTQDYGSSDLASAGREMADQIASSIRRSGRPAWFAPQLAILLFTEPEPPEECQVESVGPPSTLTTLVQDFCSGIDDGLRSCANPAGVPLIGCSVAAIADAEECKVRRRAATLTVLVARETDLCAFVGSGRGFFSSEAGHELAVRQCLEELDYDRANRTRDGGQARPEEGFVIAFFPSFAVRQAGELRSPVASENRMRKAHSYLRMRIPTGIPIFGAGAADSGERRWSHVVCGGRAIANGITCARIHTALRFDIRMTHNFQDSGHALVVTELKEGTEGVMPLSVDGKPAGSVLGPLMNGRPFQVFRAWEPGYASESLLSIEQRASSEFRLMRPVAQHTVLRPVAHDEKCLASWRQSIGDEVENGELGGGLVISLSCYGTYTLLDNPLQPADPIFEQRLAAARDDLKGIPMLSALAFGELGIGSDNREQVQNFHNVSVILADNLAHEQRQLRQLKVVADFSQELLGRLREVEDATGRAVGQEAALNVIAECISRATAALGYDGGRILTISEADETISSRCEWGVGKSLGTAGPAYCLDESNIMGRICRGDERLHYISVWEVPVGDRTLGSQTITQLWDGNCLGVLQLFRASHRKSIDAGERSTLVAIAAQTAVHLSRIEQHSILTTLEKGVREAISVEMDDHTDGYCHFANVAAEVLGVPFCLIRVLDRTRCYLKLVGGKGELYRLTDNSKRKFVDVRTSRCVSKVVFELQKSRPPDSPPEIEVKITYGPETEPTVTEELSSNLSGLYSRIRTYAACALVTPQGQTIGAITFASYRNDLASADKKALIRSIASRAALVARAFRGTVANQALHQSYGALADLQALVMSASGPEAFDEAARLLVQRVIQIIPSEACTLHCFEEGRLIRLKAAAPDESIHDKREWDLLNEDDHGFLLHLATGSGMFRMAGDQLRLHQKIRNRSGVWNWLKKSLKLHSIMAIPLVAASGKRLGHITLYNRLNEQDQAEDDVHFGDVEEGLVSFLRDIATHLVEWADLQSRYDSRAERGSDLIERLGTSIVGAADESVNFFSRLAEVIARSAHADICSIYLFSSSQSVPILRGCHGWVDSSGCVGEVSFRMTNGCGRDEVVAMKPLVAQDVRLHSRVKETHDDAYSLAKYGPRDPKITYDMTILPLRTGKTAIGVMTLDRRLPVELASVMRFDDLGGVGMQLAAQLAALAISTFQAAFEGRDLLKTDAPAAMRVFTQLMAASNRHPNLNAVAEQIAVSFSARLCGIFIVDDRAEHRPLVLKGASGILGRYVDQLTIERYDGLLGEAYDDVQVKICSTPGACRFIGRCADALSSSLAPGALENLLVVPLPDSNGCGGLLVLANQETEHTADEQVAEMRGRLVQLLGSSIILVVRNATDTLYRSKLLAAIGDEQLRGHGATWVVNLLHALRGDLQTLESALAELRRLSNGDDTFLGLCLRMENARTHLVTSVASFHSDLIRDWTEEPTYVQEAVQKAIEFEREALEERHVEVQHEIPSSLMVLADEGPLAVVIANLIRNAIKALPPTGGVVRLTSEVCGQAVILAVADTGRGMRPEEIERAKKATPPIRTSIGNLKGVGLPICKLILDRWQARLDINSEGEGLGTTVTLHLRLAKGLGNGESARS